MEQNDQTARLKNALRQQLREIQAEQSQDERAESDEALRAQFLAHPKLERARTVLLFYGVGTEPDTVPLITALLQRGVRVCLPRCLPERQMQARAITDLGQLSPDRYGIPAPGEDCPVVEKRDLDLILVPALCYDSRGSRLGQGGGYYDRYLEDYEGASIGLCREEYLQVLLPRHPLDALVGCVLTEEGQVWPRVRED